MYSSSEFNEPPLTGEYRTRTSTGRLAIMDSRQLKRYGNQDA